MSDLDVRAFELEFETEIKAFDKTLAEYGIFVYLGKFKREGWTSRQPFYLFNCDVHGLIVDYPHGYGNEKRRVCMKCAVK